jgi:hypothetical protein
VHQLNQTTKLISHFTFIYIYIYLFILQGQGVGLIGMCLMGNLTLLPAEPSSSKSDLGKGNGGFCLQNISFTLVEFFYVPYSLMTRPPALLPL